MLISISFVLHDKLKKKKKKLVNRSFKKKCESNKYLEKPLICINANTHNCLGKDEDTFNCLIGRDYNDTLNLLDEIIRKHSINTMRL